VYNDTDHKLAQSTLASLALADRSANQAATPWLYRRVVLEDNKSRKKWEETYASKVNPWSLCKERNGQAIAFKPEEACQSLFPLENEPPLTFALTSSFCDGTNQP
jgi:hypothetical protein